jgi:hypothetical protein
MEDRIEAFACAESETLGHLEDQLAADGRELLRQAAELGAQKKADATPPRCPHCLRALTRQSAGHQRTFVTRFGEVTVRRTRGYCPKCRKWRVPADEALGLAETAGYSPAVQEMTALLASKMPVGEASVVLERLTGIKVPRATLDREARRQGERAQALRRELDAHPVSQVRQTELPLEPYQMILQIDAWNIRERDQWGASAACRKKGAEPERWHWVYTGTCFRLDHRAQTAGDCGAWFCRHASRHRCPARTTPRRGPPPGPGPGRRRPGGRRRGGLDLAAGRRPVSGSAPAAGFLSRRAASRRRRPRSLR